MRIEKRGTALDIPFFYDLDNVVIFNSFTFTLLLVFSVCVCNKSIHI